MKLLGSHTSPFARKVRVVLAEKKIECEFIVASPRGEDSIVPNYNPLGQIPVLLVDEHTPLFDSPVIVEYLDNVTPNNKLFPAPNRERTEVKRWEAVCDGLLDAAVAIRAETLRPKAEQSSDFIAKKHLAIERSLAFVAKKLGDQTYCMGTHFGHADIATGCALGYLDFRFPQIDWRSSYPNLCKLYEKLAQRSSFADTVPHE